MSSYSESQVDERTGPNHPNAKKIAEELANGERFYAGTYRVGG
ncbi:hypothetical protein [uncultured Amnibacterium sp.]